MKFFVYKLIETRSDNHNLKGYRISLDDKIYVVYYDNTALREVYFINYFSNYFMSCRSDMTTISHYYIKGKLIKRYENNIHNQTYVMVNDDITTCMVADKKKVYKVSRKNYPDISSDKLYSDLTRFLQEFNSLGLSKNFMPQEPV